jgi:hypothetical protein
VSKYTYFMIPPESVPVTRAYPVWFSIWTKGASTTLTWSETPPGVVDDSLPVWVIGRVEDTDPPKGSLLTWPASKCIPPPSMKISPTISMSDFQVKFGQYLTTRGV